MPLYYPELSFSGFHEDRANGARLILTFQVSMLRHYRLNPLIFTSIFNFPLSARRRKEELRTEANSKDSTVHDLKGEKEPGVQFLFHK
jgi:hypothetical protein